MTTKITKSVEMTVVIDPHDEESEIMVKFYGDVNIVDESAWTDRGLYPSFSAQATGNVWYDNYLYSEFEVRMIENYVRENRGEIMEALEQEVDVHEDAM